MEIAEGIPSGELRWHTLANPSGELRWHTLANPSGELRWHTLANPSGVLRWHTLANPLLCISVITEQRQRSQAPGVTTPGMSHLKDVIELVFLTSCGTSSGGPNLDACIWVCVHALEQITALPGNHN
jgi:hypothetical protein